MTVPFHIRFIPMTSNHNQNKNPYANPHFSGYSADAGSCYPQHPPFLSFALF